MVHQLQFRLHQLKKLYSLYDYPLYLSAIVVTEEISFYTGQALSRFDVVMGRWDKESLFWPSTRKLNTYCTGYTRCNSSAITRP